MPPRRPTLGRWLPAVASLLTLWASPAEARGPCEGPLPPVLSDLEASLQRGQAPQWRAAAEGAARQAALLEDPQAKACAHYLAGQGHFYLSAVEGRDDPAEAAQALIHLWRAAQIWPEALASPQAKIRLRTAWRRLAPVRRWQTRRPLMPTALPQRGPEGRLVLTPPAEACGGPCPEALRFSLPLPAPGAAPPVLPLGPGDYRVEIHTACGVTRGDLAIPLTPGPDPWPKAPRCAAQITAQDALTGAAVEGFTVEGADGPLAPADWVGGALITVSAPGYVATTVSVPAAGGPLPIALTRCAAPLLVETVPPTATVEGAEPGPWGPRALTAKAPGHAILTETVQVPPACGAPFPVQLTLARQIAVSAQTASGEAVAVGQIEIDGARRPAARLALTPGTYRWRLQHPEAGDAMGALTVPPCEAALCPPAPLSIQLPGGDHWRPSTLTALSGGAFLAGALLSGGLALGAQREIDGYGTRAEEREPIDRLVRRRDTFTTSANLLGGLGLGLVATGLIWRWLEDS